MNQQTESADKAEYVTCIWFELGEKTPLPIMYWNSSIYKNQEVQVDHSIYITLYLKKIINRKIENFHKNNKYLSN